MWTARGFNWNTGKAVGAILGHWFSRSGFFFFLKLIHTTDNHKYSKGNDYKTYECIYEHTIVNCHCTSCLSINKRSIGTSNCLTLFQDCKKIRKINLAQQQTDR